jgi:hypothetical protein
MGEVWMDEKEITESCKGCNLYDKKRKYCYEFGDIKENCPCRICIVKMICRTHCDDALLLCREVGSE